LKSLSRSAIVLSLENVLGLLRPRTWLGSVVELGVQAGMPELPSGVPAPPAELGVKFVNCAREAGLNAKTIFGDGMRGGVLRLRP
jgi:hypothetical protein